MLNRIGLRQRIKTIETIKKTTGAMRLIAMSLHSQLRGKKTLLDNYKKALNTIHAHLSEEASHETSEEAPTPSHQLFLLVSSQKGLCGSFNQTLFSSISQNKLITANDHVITVGKEAENYCNSHGIKPVFKIPLMQAQQFIQTAEILAAWIEKQNSDELVVLSMKPHSFFIQQPTKFALSLKKEENSNELAGTIRNLSLIATLIQILYDSLLAEQAARFLSMDSATQNADKMLTDTKIAYNKRRQADVTRELAELTSALSS